MSGRKDFLKIDINLREWVNRLYTDIEHVREMLENHSFNIARADLDLANKYRENIFEEIQYQSISLEPLFDESGKCCDFIVSNYSSALKESGFFGDAAITGSSFIDLVGDFDGKYLEFLLRSQEKTTPMICEYYHQKTERAYRLITQPEKQGQLKLLLQDITAEQLYHLNVKRYENLFSKAQEISSNGFFQYNTHNQELYVTDGVLNIFECPKTFNLTERIKLQGYLSCVHDDDKEKVLAMISEDKIGSSLDYQHRILVRGKQKYIHVKASAFYDPIEDSISLIGTVDDITKQNKVEQALDQVKHIMNELEMLSHTAYWEYDILADKFTGTSEAVNILGLNQTDQPISFGDFLNLVHEEDRGRFYEEFHISLSQHRDWERDFRLIDKFGVQKNVHIICRNSFDEKGKPVASRGFICNQTELKKYEYASNELKGVKTRLIDLEQGFDEKLNSLLSEIRNKDKYQIQKYKHNAVSDLLSQLSSKWLGSLNLLSTQVHNCKEAFEFGELTEEKFHEIHNMIKAQIDKMTGSFEQIRKYYPARKNQKIFQPSAVVRELVDYLQDENNEKGIKIELDLSDGKIVGNPGEFHQVLSEIIKNSQEELIKREIDDPAIRISTQVNETHYIVEICDNAGGISEGIIDRIFEPYYSSPEKSQSSGLGLYISKMIVERSLKGSISAQNQNLGAFFVIKLPLADN